MKSVTIFFVNIVTQKGNHQIAKNIEFTRFLRHKSSKKL